MTTPTRPCDYCATPTPGQVEHSIPRAQGGTDHSANLAHACTRCNNEKANRTVEQWAADRVRVGLSWPPIGGPAFRDGLIAELDNGDRWLIGHYLSDVRQDVLDLYQTARHSPSFTFAKAAADLRAAVLTTA